MENRQTYFLYGGLVLIFLLLIVTVLMGGLISNNLTGAVTTGETSISMLDLAPQGFSYQEPEDTSAQAAAKSLEQAELDLEEMKKMNYISIFANDALIEAKTAYLEEDYLHVFKLTQLVDYVKKERVDFFDRVRLLEIKKQVLEEKGVTDFSDVNELRQQAMNAFTLDQFDEAETFLDEANKELNSLGKEKSRLKMLALLSKNLFVRYWWQSLIGLLMVIILGIFLSWKIRINIFFAKIDNLKLEFEQTKELIKRLQKECFLDKAITVKSYKEKAAKYEDRIAEIKQAIPILEAKVKRVKNERKRSMEAVNHFFQKVFFLISHSVLEVKRMIANKKANSGRNYRRKKIN